MNTIPSSNPIASSNCEKSLNYMTMSSEDASVAYVDNLIFSDSMSEENQNKESISKLSVSSTTRLLPTSGQISLTKRVIIFSVAVFGNFCLYLYYSVPMSFLANEIIEV